ncbi:IS607 family element RNA-guided endonuclease TnpB [Streptacidiphilus sp. N1-10]|uniref:IS607 family element RNA-guided endonuclease TnpB n=1 Tax=Streptacidiphilus jeojiensis TaxID=3229225 RepID=A0ABV6XR88_9ACTN
MKKFQTAEGCVVQAYRFALDPSPVQAAALSSHAGAARRAYNWAIGRIKANWDQRAAEASYEMTGDDLTPWQGWSLPALRRDWNATKNEAAPWWAENSKEAYSTGLANAAAAMKNWNDSRKGQRKGKRVGFPRFKKKHKAAQACRFTTGSIRVEPDRRHVTLPRLGTIRTHENTRKLERRLADGRARILSATVRRESSGRWFCSFQVEVQRTVATASRPGTCVGVDLGIKVLAVLADSDGAVRYVPNPKHLDVALAGLRRANRVMARRQGPTVIDPDTGRRCGYRTPSTGWQQAKADLGKAHARVRHLRADGLHKFTTDIAAQYGTVVVEDLNVTGMLRNHRLARRIADAGFGEIRRQLTYKTAWNGGNLVVADRWYPSSKTCSACGTVKAKLPLGVRVFACDNCALVLDRDENAARNLADLASAVQTGTGVAGDPDAQASKARGADQKTRNRTELARSGRAGGAIPAQRGTETGHRHQDTQALTLW